MTKIVKSEPRRGFIRFCILNAKKNIEEIINKYNGFFSDYSCKNGVIIVEFYNNMPSDLGIINEFESDIKEN